jgi:hypothetical protein
MRPTSLRFRVLRLIVENPGDLTAESIAAHLFPPPKLAGPLSSAEAWRARRRAVECHKRGAERKVRRAIDALQGAGLVVAHGAPMVSEWFSGSIERWTLPTAIERAHPAWPRKLPDLAAYRSIVEAATAGPSSAGALLGSNPSGSRKRRYRELCSWGCLVAPSQRVPTEAGVALVSQLKEVA